MRTIASRCSSMIALARCVAFRDDALDLVVDLDRGRLGVVAVLGDLAAEEDLLFLLAEGQRPQSSLMPHSQTILRARSVARSMSLPAPVVMWFEEDLLGDAAAHQDGELRLEVLLGVGVLVVDRQAAW